MQQRQDSNWNTHYTFISIPNKTFFIKKSELNTWEDLVYAIGEEMRLQYEFIQIMVNQKKVDYERDTFLVDINITQDDVCIVAKRKKFNSKEEREEYQIKRQQLRMKCMKEILREEEYPDVKKMIEFAQNKYKDAFKSLGKKYGRIIAAVALYNYEYKKEESIKAYIQSGDAASYMRRIIVANEKKQLQAFLQKNQIKELKDKIFKEKLHQFDQFAYRAIMQELYNVYPDFKRLQFRHRKLVKKYFFEEKYREENDSEQQQRNDDKEYLFTNKKRARDQFIQKMRLKSYTNSDITEAFYQAGNDYRKAEQLLSKGLVYGVQDKPFLIKQPGRINYLLQFLANPKFKKIRQSLANDKTKATRFLQWICDQNQDQIFLCDLIKRYKEHAVSYLTGQQLSQ